MSCKIVNSLPKCANCGKEGSEVTNTCNKCNMVMYCNAACKKKHRHKHKKDCEENVRRVAENSVDAVGMQRIIAEGLRNNPTAVSSSAVTTPLTEEDIFPVIMDNDKIDNKAWLRVSKFILGEELATQRTPAGIHIHELLHTLLKTVKEGCCSNVGPGYMCGHCESSKNVIRISRAVILSICKLPLELNDDISRKELDRIRGWIYKQITKFRLDMGLGNDTFFIQSELPPQMRDLVARSKGTDCIDIQPPWEEDDFGILLQQPSSTWIIRINMLMLMGYKVALLNFSDIARFSRKELKVVHDDISRILCHPIEVRSDGEVDKRVAELNDQALFKEPPPAEDCPICCVRLPSLVTGSRYKACCGKLICSGCIYTSKRVSGRDLCAFCRMPAPASREEILQRTMKRMKLKDAQAIYQMGVYYAQGQNGLPQDMDKALKLWHRAAELGCMDANCIIGVSYADGRGVEEDTDKARHYLELAACDGHALSRRRLGFKEIRLHNWERALKHFIIAVKDGDSDSLKKVGLFFKNGYATKEDYEKSLLLYQRYQKGIKSEQRDAAAASKDDYKYYQTT